MGAWPVVIQVKRAQSAFEKLIEGSQEPPLEYVGLMTDCLSSSNSKNSWPFFFPEENAVCHSFSTSSHSFFLLNKKEFLLGCTGKFSATLTCSSTSLCLGHWALLGYCQKYMLFLRSFSKNDFMDDVIGRMAFWRGLGHDSRIYLAAEMASVTTRIR